MFFYRSTPFMVSGILKYFNKRTIVLRAGGQRSRRTRPSWVFFLFTYFIMPETKDESAEGNRMIREIQEQRRREESAEANSMIRKIQAQQKLARQLMYEAETRTRVKPPPSRRQLMKKKGKVFRGYNALLSRHLENKQRKVENAEANSMIRQIQAQQKLARHLMRLAETRTRIKPPPSRRQLTKKYGIGKVFRGYNGLLSNHLENKQRKEDVRHRLSNILGRKTNKNKNNTKKKYTL